MLATISKSDLKKYYQDLQKRRDLGYSEKDIIDYHYYRLGVVDNKTNSLLQYNGIALAALIILISSEREIIRVNSLYEITFFLFAFAFSFAALLTLLSSITLRWRVICDGETLEKVHDSLICSTIRRTKIYRRGLRFSQIGGWALIICFILIFFRSGIFNPIIDEIQRYI